MNRALTKFDHVFLIVWNTIVIVASAFLIYELSTEILKQINPSITSRYSQVVFWVCSIFILDFFVSMYYSVSRWKFIRRQYIFFLISIPYHNIFLFMDWPMSEILIYIFRILLLIRSIRGVGLLIRLLTANAVNRILISYTFYLVMILYFSSISFYYFEKGVNSGINDYGDAIWWAFMALTTEGSNIHPVTIEGRIITGILITSGLGLFTLIVAGFANRFSKMKTTTNISLTDIGLSEDLKYLKKMSSNAQTNAAPKDKAGANTASQDSVPE